MGDSYNESSNLWRDAIRGVFAFLDRPAYWLLGLVYQLFFNVASADIFSNNTIMKFYGRVQVILGVFMMFQLAMTILRGIIEPDSFSKEKGGGSLIRRVAISLMLITVLMPISVGNPRNEYEKQLNNNGLLFGTLYSLQHRILSNNTLGRLVLGTTEDKSTYISADDEDELEKSSRIFTSTILKGFYRINLVPESERVDTGTKDPATANKNRMCQDIDDEVMRAYTRIDAEPGEIISMVNETCEPTFNLVNHIPIVSSFGGTKKYMINYMPFISMIVAIVFVFILLSFTIDVAVRAVKLAILRLVAPIPIIAYMDPKGSGDEAFKSWGKVLVSTYLDLFIRLAVVYFVIFIIQDMIVNGIVIEHGTGVLGVLSLIVIWIGLFVFAKQAPKFIRQVLGLKGDPGKLFSGFGDLFSTVGGIGATAAGTIGSAISGARASRESSLERGRYLGRQEAERRGLTGAAAQQFVDNYAQRYAGSFWNRGRQAVAAMAGGASGAVTGASAAWNAKDHAGRAAFDAIAKKNAARMAAGRNGGTVFGAIGSDIGQMFTGESAYDRMEAGWKAEEQRLKNAELDLKRSQDENAHRKAAMDRAKSKAIDSDKTTGTYMGISGNYRDYHSVSQAALLHGTGVYQHNGEDVFDFHGQRVRVADADNIDLGLKDANTASFYEKVVQYERDIAAGMTDAQAKARGGISDNSILGDRRAFRTSTGHDMEDVYEGASGLKATYGDRANVDRAEADRINRGRADINNQRQGYQGQRAASNSRRFHSGGGGK